MLHAAAPVHGVGMNHVLRFRDRAAGQENTHATGLALICQHCFACALISAYDSFALVAMVSDATFTGVLEQAATPAVSSRYLQIL